MHRSTIWRHANPEKYNSQPSRQPEKARKRSASYYRRHKETVNNKAKVDRVGKYARREFEARLIKKYGPTAVEEWHKRLIDQVGLCKLCHKHKKQGLRMDHDHTTGRIRGLLCIRCNVALAALGDNAEGISRTLEYVL